MLNESISQEALCAPVRPGGEYHVGGIEFDQ
jgi:hypothetical protein